jgi:hypothetical protein
VGRSDRRTGDRFVDPVSSRVLALLGMDVFVFWPPAAGDPIGQTELFATEVAPAVRAALDA